MNIENQAIVSVHGTGSQIIADITLIEGANELKITASGTSQLTTIEALSLISLFQECFKIAWQNAHKAKSGPQG